MLYFGIRVGGTQKKQINQSEIPRKPFTKGLFCVKIICISFFVEDGAVKVKLNANETYYRQIVFSIGVAMVALLLLMNVSGWLQDWFQNSIRESISDPIAADVAEQLFYAGTYLLVFLLPAYLLRYSIRKRGLIYYPIKAELRLSKYLPIILFGGVFLVWTQSYINGMLVSVFNYSAFSSDVLWEQQELQYNYQVMLRLLVAALVPAFCEEFLFRGAVLTNLLPFGRGPAILISSLLFAVMHQNAEQVLYAFSAGVLLGLVYERTGSIWNCFFLHLANNFASVLVEVMVWRLPFDNELIWVIMETALCVICIGCVFFLTFVLKRERPNAEDGFFEKSTPSADGNALHPISSFKAVQLFFNFPMILFLGSSVAQMISLIGMAWVYSYGA